MMANNRTVAANLTMTDNRSLQLIDHRLNLTVSRLAVKCRAGQPRRGESRIGVNHAQRLQTVFVQLASQVVFHLLTRDVVFFRSTLANYPGPHSRQHMRSVNYAAFVVYHLDLSQSIFRSVSARLPGIDSRALNFRWIVGRSRTPEMHAIALHDLRAPTPSKVGQHIA